ncbi:hypothetical protein [Coraliomargarita akajimensis]|uniref:Uncharacterized protein n=1 Tax=Coraliomargarita akajimensis (strain DSM 45221 / IAM 15411 / JCM 23193 / KCTC 12865 / 04OKA010-24) TaxID=583355 RepID=D5ELL5_CORAD|nr:hypothetical protein [Coraliomargarita akajimensis]ADE55151.1 conserved hypothetical protein [Coraliomargarita akajimensis DSM 45221]
MSLFQATLFTGIFLILFGGHFAWHGLNTEKSTKAFPRSQVAAYILMGAASAWFLYHVWNLGPADFGQYRKILFAVFAVTAVGSFYFVPDFLAVRGLAGLILLIANELLGAAYLQEPQARLFLVSFVYFAIVVALILGASPYKLRDFFSWLFNNAKRPRLFGSLFAGYGLLLVGISFTY